MMEFISMQVLIFALFIALLVSLLANAIQLYLYTNSWCNMKVSKLSDKSLKCLIRFMKQELDSRTTTPTEAKDED